MKCPGCEAEMLCDDVTTCTLDMVTMSGIAGVRLYLRDSKYFDVNERCHDCNIVNKPGNFHHAGCDMERCPKCGGQLISCICSDEVTFGT